MNIGKIQNTYPQNIRRTPAFKSCSRAYSGVWTPENIITFTRMFRGDINWEKFANFVANFAKRRDQVNIYSMACSDGSEAYTLGIALLENLKKEILKKISILATDRDTEVIKAARSGRINLNNDDLIRISKFTGGKTYFEDMQPPVLIENDILQDKGFYRFSAKKDDLKKDFKGLASYKPVESLSDLIRFNLADMDKQMSMIKDEGNSIILCRNVMPYLTHDYIKRFTETAEKILKRGSVIILGGFDRLSKFHTYINLDKFDKISNLFYVRNNVE